MKHWRKFRAWFCRGWYRQFYSKRVYTLVFCGDPGYEYGDLLIFNESRVAHKYLGKGYVFLPKQIVINN